MDVYVARQPIFNRSMGLYGYELLYRKSSENYYEGVDHNAATAELVNNSFLVMNFNRLTDGTKGFLNFTQDLIENEIPTILPKDKVVIEILESVEASESVVEKCKNLKAEGYTIALDDFIFWRIDCDYTPLIELADIIKIEYPTTNKQEQQKMIEKYKNQIIFLAEKVETREEYQEALVMGYELFQGYFFSKPTIIKAKEIASVNIHLIRILEELQKKEPNFYSICETIQKDLGLSFKILKIANSIYFGSRKSIQSIRQALIRLGTRELKRWISIILVKEFENPENAELIKICLLRGKMMALLSHDLHQGQSEIEFFLAGILSSIDVIINDSMENIVTPLALSTTVKDALLAKPGTIKYCLDCILEYERFEFDEVKKRLVPFDISLERFMECYVEALTWLKTTDE